jgi:hypothetical protein
MLRSKLPHRQRGAPAAGAASAEMLALHAPEGLGLRLAEDDLDAHVAPSSVIIER